MLPLFPHELSSGTPPKTLQAPLPDSPTLNPGGIAESEGGKSKGHVQRHVRDSR